jgi:multidrug efflux pump subunit AcrA (membrane-fusion protein)
MSRTDPARGLVLLLAVSLALSLGPGSRSAGAHGADEEPITPALSGIQIIPRVAAEGSDFELVGVARGKTLSIWVDRMSDNKAIAAARVEVEFDGQSATVEAGPDGVYRLTADWVAQPGRHDIVFTVRSDGGSDLLAGSLEVPAAGPILSQPSRSGAARGLDNIVAFVLGMIASFGLRRRRGFYAAIAARTSSTTAAMRGLVSGVRPRVAAILARLTVSAARGAETVLSLMRAARTAMSGERAAGIVGFWVRAVRRHAPLPMSRRYGWVELSIVAILCTLTIALILFSRGVFAGEPAGNPDASGVVSAIGAADGPRRLMDGSLFVPKASQRLLNVRTTVTTTSEVARTLRVVGQVIPDPGTSGEIHSTIRGRLQPFQDTWPKVGQKVEVGDILAWVVPVINPIDRGIILQQVAQINHEIDLAEQHLKELSASESEAEPGDVEGARDDLANLGRRREAIAAVLRDRDTLRAPLVAPSSGIIAASFAIAGQVVDEQQKLFAVVNPKRLWVEAYAYDVMEIGNVRDANAESPTAHHYHLKFVSRGPQLQRQTIPLYFQIENPDELLSVGSLLSVLVETSGDRSGVIIPRTAVARDTSGQDIVWRHAGPESFVPVPVRVEPIDGNNVLIAAGLPPDTRIVVEAAGLLNEVR